MNRQRLVVLVLSIAGMLGTFLPWVQAPIVGSVNGTKGDGWITLGLFAIPLVVVLLKDRMQTLDMKRMLIASAGGVVAAIIGIWKMIDLNNSMKSLGENELFGKLFSSSVSIGFGLYVIVIAGLAIPVYLFLGKKFKV